MQFITVEKFDLIIVWEKVHKKYPESIKSSIFIIIHQKEFQSEFE